MPPSVTTAFTSKLRSTFLVRIRATLVLEQADSLTEQALDDIISTRQAKAWLREVYMMEIMSFMAMDDHDIFGNGFNTKAYPAILQAISFDFQSNSN